MRPRELTEEEAALRHKLELKVERALYRAAVVLLAHQDESSAHHYLDCGCSDEQKVERAFGEAQETLQELRDRCLYRSTHRSFNQYLRERFGSYLVEVLPGGS